MQRRLAELEQEKKVSPCPPVIVGGALIIPMGLLNRIMGRPNAGQPCLAQTAPAIERAAMDAVTQRELARGFLPRDVSAENVGYDIESVIPESRRNGGHCLRFIEVKGRRKGPTTVTVTRNEILTALNKPDEYILAIVEVDGAPDEDRVYPQALQQSAGSGRMRVNYEIADLLRIGEIEE